MGRATRKVLGRAVVRRVRSMVKSNDKQKEKEKRKSKNRFLFMEKRRGLNFAHQSKAITVQNSTESKKKKRCTPYKKPLECHNCCLPGVSRVMLFV
jgi:hypothetical protein